VQYRAGVVDGAGTPIGDVPALAGASVTQRIEAQREELTVTERRIAEVVLTAPQTVAFGTVAEVAAAAEAGAATVVRLAAKLGYDGFTELQAAVQRDVIRRLRPAAERIREQAGGDAAARHRAVELDNVRGTLDAVDESALAALVARLAEVDHPVLVLSGDASRGVAWQFVHDLGLLRPGVGMLEGNEVAVRRLLATAPADRATVVTLDLRRYDRWVVETLERARAGGAWVAALTDGVLSPLAASADVTFVLEAGAIGPVDSHVGTMALLNRIVQETASALRAVAVERLDAIEAAWQSSLSDG
jgi:DNA-binding MurR/RpiR family transcriptional regulator